jgi:hypothetical protein
VSRMSFSAVCGGRITADCPNNRFKWAELKLELFLGPNARMNLPKDVTDALKELKKDSRHPDLDAAYSAIYDLNTRPGSESRRYAERALKWLLCSMRPLTMTELVHAVSVGPRGDIQQDVDENLIRKICSSFIRTDASNKLNNTVDLAHLSVREYLEGRDEFASGFMNSQVAETCLAYMSNSKCDPSPTRNFEDGFPRYALMWCFSHWERAAEKTGPGSLGKLFRDFVQTSPGNVWSPLQHWVATVSYFHKGEWTDTQRAFNRMKKGEPFTFHDIYRLVSAVPSRYLQNESTSFFAACTWGFDELLEVEPFNFAEYIGKRNEMGKAGLHLASTFGFDTVVGLLLKKGANVNLKDNEGITALEYALYYGHTSVVRVLLKHGADSAVDEASLRNGMRKVKRWEGGLELEYQLLHDRDYLKFLGPNRYNPNLQVRAFFRL